MDVDFLLPFRDHAGAKDCIYCNMAFRMSKTAIYSCTHTFFVFLLRYTLPNSSFLSSIIGYLKFYFFFFTVAVLL